VDELEVEIKKYNKLVSTYKTQISSFNSKVTDYNNAADEIYGQY